ncbi:MAG TPA: VOC family protein [Vicinamibacterales bacterium]|nr:VOC family protein [Vicinamibacterales bacterium]
MRTVLTAVALTLVALRGSAQAPTPLVTGSGNFFSPIVANLEKATAFYRDGLGLGVMGAPSTGDDNAPLRAMFGLPMARLRWTVARPAGSRNGVEIVEVTSAGGRLLQRRMDDPGAMTLVYWVPDVAAIATKLKAHGGTTVASSTRTSPTGTSTVLRDPDDHFVELRPGPMRTSPWIRLTVANVTSTLALYRDRLGIPAVIDANVTAVEIPGSRLTFEFVGSHSQRHVAGRIQDPGSTRLQLQVRDLDAAIRAVVAAGGQVISTGGVPVELPAGRGAPIHAAIVRDPNNLFLVLIATTPPAA